MTAPARPARVTTGNSASLPILRSGRSFSLNWDSNCVARSVTAASIFCELDLFKFSSIINHKGHEEHEDLFLIVVESPMLTSLRAPRKGEAIPKARRRHLRCNARSAVQVLLRYKRFAVPRNDVFINWFLTTTLFLCALCVLCG